MKERQRTIRRRLERELRHLDEICERLLLLSVEVKALELELRGLVDADKLEED